MKLTRARTMLISKFQLQNIRFLHKQENSHVNDLTRQRKLIRLFLKTMLSDTLFSCCCQLLHLKVSKSYELKHFFCTKMLWHSLCMWYLYRFFFEFTMKGKPIIWPRLSCPDFWFPGYESHVFRVSVFKKNSKHVNIVCLYQISLYTPTSTQPKSL